MKIIKNIFINGKKIKGETIIVQDPEEMNLNRF